MIDLRQTIARQVRSLVGSDSVDLSRPPGDDGLFGPGSAAWAVHGDFTAMMIGGISALLLQMLNPLALAGVWDHSDWRNDRHGRLKRTAQFITVTTYGATEAAEAMIARVARIHDRVAGTLPDGTLYSANDPALLSWVHAAEADSFLRAYLRYRDPGFPAARQDAYLAEVAQIARRLGATDVPDSRRALAEYFHAVRPQLRADVRSREVAAVLLDLRGQGLAMPAAAMLARAGVELLPPWAAHMHGFRLSPAGRPAVRIGARGIGGVLRWALARGSRRPASA